MKDNNNNNNNNNFYIADSFNRCADIATAYSHTTDNCSYTLAANSIDGLASAAKTCSDNWAATIDSLSCCVDNFASSESIQSLSERISALEANESKKNVNIFKKPFLKYHFGRLRRADLKTLNYNVG